MHVPIATGCGLGLALLLAVVVGASTVEAAPKKGACPTKHVQVHGLPRGGGAVCSDVSSKIVKRPSSHPLVGSIAVGKARNIEIRDTLLVSPIVIELHYDRKKLPKGRIAEEIFLARFDSAAEQWVPVGGELVQGNMIRLETQQLGIWQPRVWDWQKPADALRKVRTEDSATKSLLDKSWGSITELVESVGPIVVKLWKKLIKQAHSAGKYARNLVEELVQEVREFVAETNRDAAPCAVEGAGVRLVGGSDHGILKGCMGTGSTAGTLTVTNKKAYTIRVRMADAQGRKEPILLGPGATHHVNISLAASPMTITTHFDQQVFTRFVIDLAIQLLPVANYRDNKVVECVETALTATQSYKDIVSAMRDDDPVSIYQALGKVLMGEAIFPAILHELSVCGKEVNIPLLRKLTGEQAVKFARIVGVISATSYFLQFTGDFLNSLPTGQGSAMTVQPLR
jgi:hypothetical protein